VKFLEVKVWPFVRFSLHRGVRDKTLFGDTTPNAKFSNTLDRAAKLHNFPTPSPLYTADLSENGLANQERYPAFEDVHPFQPKQVNRLSRNKVRTPEDFVSFWVHFETQESA
jgi:hypothetical protein